MHETEIEGLAAENAQWQDLINEVTASDIPIELLKYLRVHLNDGTKYVFPVLKWAEEDEMTFEEIKKTVIEWMFTNQNDILGSDFVVNLEKLKDTVTTATANTLKNL